MACSIECFQEYMNRIEKSRNPVTRENAPIENEESTITPKMKGRKRKSSESEITSENIIMEN